MISHMCLQTAACPGEVVQHAVHIGSIRGVKFFTYLLCKLACRSIFILTSALFYVQIEFIKNSNQFRFIRSRQFQLGYKVARAI
ncbi:MAG: hypothetical protein JW384_02840 [Nitrosomonadaceae bacterium]|nr:hypothetical protein [Nitrosomonadaceae bacterium]